LLERPAGCSYLTRSEVSYESEQEELLAKLADKGVHLEVSNLKEPQAKRWLDEQKSHRRVQSG
jgi:hypothetical protein